MDKIIDLRVAKLEKEAKKAGVGINKSFFNEEDEEDMELASSLAEFYKIYANYKKDN